MHPISYISDDSKRIIKEIETMKARKNLEKVILNTPEIRKSPNQYSLKDIELIK